MLDLIEEIIHHALATGNSRAAWDLYQNRMGGCKNLLAGINDFVRARRVTIAIKQAHESGAEVSSAIEIVLCSDSGYSNLSLGSLVAAKSSLEKGLALCREYKSSNLSVLSTNLARTYYAIGNVGAAIAMLQELLESQRNPSTYLEMAEWLAELNAEQGQVQTKIGISDVPLQLQHKLVDRLPLIVRSEHLDSGHLSKNHLEEVHQLEKEHPKGHESLATALLEYAASAAKNSELQAAYEAASKAFDWAVAHPIIRQACATSPSKAGGGRSERSKLREGVRLRPQTKKQGSPLPNVAEGSIRPPPTALGEVAARKAPIN